MKKSVRSDVVLSSQNKDGGVIIVRQHTKNQFSLLNIFFHDNSFFTRVVMQRN